MFLQREEETKYYFLCAVLTNFTVQHKTARREIVLVNNYLLFIWLIKNAFFQTDYLFTYSLFQRGDNFEEFRGFGFFPNNN